MAKLTVSFIVILATVCGPKYVKASLDVSLNWRIVGGSKAPEGAFPYQVSIRHSNGTYKCGGAIMDSMSILTAAHCVSKQSPSELNVVVGSNHLNSGGTRHSVNSIRIHERYNSVTIKNDIAILKLSSPIRFTGIVHEIDLETSYVGTNVGALLSGWGATTNPGSTPNDLQYIILKTISTTECKGRQSLKQVDESQICTLTKTGEGACHGDSGGPLVANGRLIGIVSWGRPCAVGYPDVYTRMSHYINWINMNLY